MSDNDMMAAFEAEFGSPDNSGPSTAEPRPCRECGIRDAYDPGCESCWSVDGDCCYCRICGAARLDQMAAGAIEGQQRAKAAGDRPTLHALTYCDAMQLAHVLIEIILALTGDVGGLAAEVREAHRFRRADG